MCRSFNSILGEKKTGSSVIQTQDGKLLFSEPKAVASKFNKFSATIGVKVGNKLCSVPDTSMTLGVDTEDIEHKL